MPDIEYPEWYEGGFPSAEAVVRAMLQGALAELTPEPAVYSVLPANYGELTPMVTVFRGAGEGDDIIDYPRVQVWAICDKRSESEKLAEFCRQIIKSYDQGTSSLILDDGEKAIVIGVAEDKGPVMTPATIPSEKIAFFTYRVSIRKSGKPDYARLRKQLFIS